VRFNAWDVLNDVAEDEVEEQMLTGRTARFGEWRVYGTASQRLAWLAEIISLEVDAAIKRHDLIPNFDIQLSGRKGVLTLAKPSTVIGAIWTQAIKYVQARVERLRPMPALREED
jgi:hypothetical protein